MKLSAKEHRALAVFAKPTGQRHYGNVHGRTIHALERKGLVGYIRGGRQLTPAGIRELAAVPNIFDDLFEKKEQTMPVTKTAKAAAAITRLHTLTNVEIDAHPLLDREQKKLCKIFRDKSKKDGDEFTMLNFAEIALRATGNDYAEVTGSDDQAVICDAAHRRAALLYTYEALKRGPAIVTETIEDRGTLRDIELLASHG